MVQLQVYYTVPEGGGDRPEFTDEETSEWIRRMQAELQGAENGDEFSCEFETEAGALQLHCIPFGTAMTAAWSTGNPLEPVAFSVFLRGKSGDDDAAAIKRMKEFPELEGFDPKEFIAMQAKDRPCVGIIFGDAAWYTNGRVELAASTLAVASMSPAGSASMTPSDRALSPEEMEADRKEIERVTNLFQIIQNDWAARKKLRYTVRPSEPIKDRPVDDIMHVKFWVGVQGEGDTLGIQGLVALFLMLGQFVEQSPGLKHQRNPKMTHRLTLKNSPAVIRAVLGNVTFTDPA